MVEYALDTKGLKCPMPIVQVSKKLKDLNSGQMLEVLSDDSAFGEDIKAFCRISGYNLESFDEQDGVSTAIIKKP